MRGLSTLFLTSTSGAAGAAGAVRAWSLTFLIQDAMNSWKRSLFGAGVGAGVDSTPGDVRPYAGRLRAGLLWQAGGIVERRGRRVTSLTF